VLDVNMPDRSGLEILPELGAMAPRMRVVVVSAMPAMTMRPLALRAGAHAYLEKPVNPQLLEQSIRAAGAAAAANDEGFDGRSEPSAEEGTRT
jgi:DNA-binding NtrC family response regulator